MKIALTGSHGLIGSALAQCLRQDGHETLGLVRGAAAAAGEATWRPGLAAECLDGCDAVVHLGGARIDRRWTTAVRREIVESRVAATRALCRALAALPHRPRALLCASAIGFYGHRGNEAVDEASPVGRGFLPTLVAAWEAACDPARAAGVRVVHLRFGIVLSRNGGALARMLPFFRLGIGGPLGDGRQIMSWIHIEDALRAIRHLLAATEAAGPFNLTAPEAATNREFARALGRVLRRPALLPAPRLALHLAFGGMADEALLGGARVLPRRLLSGGFSFRQPNLDAALRALVRGREQGM